MAIMDHEDTFDVNKCDWNIVLLQTFSASIPQLRSWVQRVFVLPPRTSLSEAKWTFANLLVQIWLSHSFQWSKIWSFWFYHFVIYVKWLWTMAGLKMTKNGVKDCYIFVLEKLLQCQHHLFHMHCFGIHGNNAFVPRYPFQFHFRICHLM